MKKVTGFTNEMVLQNADYLARDFRKLYEVRAVIVPDLYDTEKSVREMGDFLAPYLEYRMISVIKIIAYRPMGVREAIFPFPGAGPEIPVLSGRDL